MNNIRGKTISVLHLISSSGFLGAENVILNLSKDAQLMGVETTIGILENRDGSYVKFVDAAQSDGVNVHIFRCRKRFDLRTIHEIRGFIKQKRFSIVHSHGFKGNFYAWASVLYKTAWVVTHHGVRDWSGSGRVSSGENGRSRNPFKLRLYLLLNNLVLRFADSIITVSGEIAADMRAQRLPDRKITVIHNGIDVDRFHDRSARTKIRKEFGFSDESAVIGTIASLTPEKGHSILIEASKKILTDVPDVRFLLVGDGSERGRLEREIAAYGLADKIIFTGSRSDIPEILSALDVFVMPSLREGLPMALLEAQAACCPVIAAKVGAIPDLVLQGETGVLVEPGRADALSAAIMNLLRDKEKAVFLAEQGYSRVKHHFSVRLMSRRYMHIYEKIISDRHGLEATSIN